MKCPAVLRFIKGLIAFKFYENQVNISFHKVWHTGICFEIVMLPGMKRKKVGSAPVAKDHSLKIV